MSDSASSPRRGRQAPTLAGQTVERLECATVLRFFARKCQTAEGRARLTAMRMLPREAQTPHFTELEAWAALLEQRAALRLPAIPGADLFDRNPHLKPFDAEELRVLGRLLAFWRTVVSDDALAFARPEGGDDPALWALTDRLGRLFDPDGDWNEHVSPLYHRLIHQWVEQDRAVEAAMTAMLRRFGAYLNEDIVFERNRRRVLAVKVDFRGRVKGILHDYSASGNTVYVEPEETVDRQYRLAQLELEIREELWRLRVEISKEVLDFPQIADTICPLLARADMMQGLCLTAKETGCVPVRPNDTHTLDLRDARHPFLCARFAAARQDIEETAEPDGKDMVAFSLGLDDAVRGLIISGANTGGKTVTLKTTGLLAWMANSGLPVPVTEGSSIPYYRHILADIGDNQSLSHNLSTFASHLANIREVLALPPRAVLVLLDELGSGTDPAEGNALAQAIIEELCSRSYHLLVTTHQQILCTMALTHPRLDNGSMIFDNRRHLPTYRFTQGVPGRSHALDIARGAGLPEAILDAAAALIDADMVDIQAAIRTLQLQTKELDKQKSKLRRDELRLHRRIKEAREEKEGLTRVKEEFKQKSRQRLQKEVEKAERELRRTLSDVSAGKARTAVTKFAKTRNAVMADYDTPQKVEAVLPEASGKTPDQWRAGDAVYLTSWHREGTLVSVDRKKARVDVGGMKVEVPTADLIHRGAPEDKPGKVMDHLEEGSDIALSAELRLLGFRVEEALLELDQTIDRALRRGVPFLRIIHGHGHGALKTAVRDFLRKHPVRTSFEVVLDQENDGVTELKFA